MQRKYKIGESVRTGVVVSYLPNGGYLIACPKCGLERNVSPTGRSGCSRCLSTGRKTLFKGVELLDGRTILDEDRSIRPPKFLVNCISCGKEVWKQRTTIYDVCFDCRAASTAFRSGNARNFSRKYVSYMQSAAKRNLEWKLDRDRAESLFLSECVYCGIQSSGGIDRIDNSAGYIPENCVSCCSQCNYAKGGQPLEVWMEWIDRMIRYRSKIEQNNTRISSRS